MIGVGIPASSRWPKDDGEELSDYWLEIHWSDDDGCCGGDMPAERLEEPQMAEGHDGTVPRRG